MTLPHHTDRDIRVTLIMKAILQPRVSEVTLHQVEMTLGLRGPILSEDAGGPWLPPGMAAEAKAMGLTATERPAER